MLQGPLDWGDPDLVAYDSTYYLYVTQSLPGVNVPMESAAPGGKWGDLHDALPALPAWAEPGATWAPDVHRFGQQWVLYFAAAYRASNPVMHCIGAAVAATPTGPFTPDPSPIECQLAMGGSIDPRVYVSPRGNPFLLFKSDNNVSPAFGQTILWSQLLAPDGRTPVGNPVPIFEPDQPWQGQVVEAPDMVTVSGHTWLFFSGGVGFWDPHYAIGVARCAGPEGPCVDRDPSPLLASNTQGVGPGEESVFTSGHQHWLLYDATRSDNGSARPMAVAPLVFGPAGPTVGAPVSAGAESAQPAQPAEAGHP